MVAEVFSAMIQGIEGQIVKIQVDISNGLPNFNMIGYLSNEVKESKERVRTALNNIGVLLPPKRISVNFAPADFRKCGTSFDIGVAAAILLAMDFVPETYIKDTLFVGELSLNGQICPISGVLPIVVAASKRGIKRCIVAQENVAEAAFVEQMEVIGCRNLEELFFYLKHGYIINDDSGEILENSGNISEDSGKECTIQDVKKSQEISESTRSLNLLVKDILENADEDKISVTDFSEVKGQVMAKRAMEIAAAGYHNLMLGGPPGVGKSMLASCISGIMPQMTTEEMIDTTIIYSAKGLLKDSFSLITKRPFRNPSLAVTQAGMFGGGMTPQPGEISLAHHGILFLDEFPEYISLFSMLIDAIKTGATLVLVGDIHQLESVGPGAVLHDLLDINDKFIPKCMLTDVFRQKGGSPIIDNSKRINEGRTSLVTGKDFQIIQTKTETESMEKVKGIMKKYYDPKDPFKIQILCPSKEGISGVVNQNTILQECLNTSKDKIFYGKGCYKVNDKIIMTKNNYEADYYNGDIGIIRSIDKNKQLHVEIREKEYVLTRDMMEDIRLAYGMTIHKSQGSEFPIVIVVMPMKPKIMLVRNLLYTAITRAKKQCIIINEGTALETAIKTIQAGNRRTRLKTLLEQRGMC